MVSNGDKWCQMFDPMRDPLLRYEHKSGLKKSYLRLQNFIYFLTTH